MSLPFQDRYSIQSLDRAGWVGACPCWHSGCSPGTAAPAHRDSGSHKSRCGTGDTEEESTCQADRTRRLFLLPTSSSVGIYPALVVPLVPYQAARNTPGRPSPGCTLTFPPPFPFLSLSECKSARKPQSAASLKTDSCRAKEKCSVPSSTQAPGPSAAAPALSIVWLRGGRPQRGDLPPGAGLFPRERLSARLRGLNPTLLGGERKAQRDIAGGWG